MVVATGRALALAALLMLAACAPRSAQRPSRVAQPPPVRVATPPPPLAVRPSPARAPLPGVPSRPGSARAADAGLRPGPAVANLALSPLGAARSLAAFRTSCPAVTRRPDTSGLTRQADWDGPCAAAAGWSSGDAVAFFASWFEAVEVGGGTALATGYYEPEIAGSRTRKPGYEVPVYASPPELVQRDGRRGRLDANGQFVSFQDRAEIEAGALAGRGLEIAWAADPIDLFFLQVQGSGRLRLPNGEVLRIGYANQNGREYTAIGRLLRDRGVLAPDNISLQTITAWMRANPAEGRALMRENRSYVFFRELTGPGPLGALALPVTPRGSVAADPLYVPLGTPVVLSGMSDGRADGLWIAQDTGGAIRGANRFDTFWGAGAEAATVAGVMQARGRALLLLPRGTLERLAGDATAQP